MPQSRKEKVNILPPICSQTESRLIMHPLHLPCPIHKSSDRLKKKKKKGFLFGYTERSQRESIQMLISDWVCQWAGWLTTANAIEKAQETYLHISTERPIRFQRAAVNSPVI